MRTHIIVMCVATLTCAVTAAMPFWYVSSRHKRLCDVQPLTFVDGMLQSGRAQLKDVKSMFPSDHFGVAVEWTPDSGASASTASSSPSPSAAATASASNIVPQTATAPGWKRIKPQQSRRRKPRTTGTTAAASGSAAAASTTNIVTSPSLVSKNPFDLGEEDE
jgi:hypothetical protein